MSETNDAINPNHYRIANSVQVIELIRLMPFSMGNAIKYCYRNGDKENAVQDLTKALWYLKDYRDNPILIDIDVEKINQLSSIVFKGLPKWERGICLKLTKFFVAVNTDVSSEMVIEFYESINEEISVRISKLSR